MLSCDQDKYSESWVLTPSQVGQMFAGDSQHKCRLRACNRHSCQTRLSCSKNWTSTSRILDLRQHHDFAVAHIRRSLSSPLKDLTPSVTDIFGNPDVLHMLWKRLKNKFDNDGEMLGSKKLPLIILCYDGDASQVATSLLRAKGFTTFSVSGGFPALKRSVLFRGQRQKGV